MFAHKDHWAKETELLELREENKRLKKEGRTSSVQFEDAGAEGTWEKWKWMKKLMARIELDLQKERPAKTSAVRQRVSRYAAGSAAYAQRNVAAGAASYFEQRRNDLLPEHQEMQKMSKKLCRAYKTKRSSAERNWASGLETVSQSGTRLKNMMPNFKSWVKKILKTSLAEVELDEEIISLQAGDRRRGSCACTDVASIQP